MKKNTILSVSLVIMQLMRIFISLLAAFHVLIFVATIVNDLPLPEAIRDIQSIITINNKGLTIQDIASDKSWLNYLIIIQNLLTLALLFSILGFGIDIIRNIKRKKTFSKPNIKAFDKISQLAVVLFAIQFWKVSPERIGIVFEFNYLFLAFGAIILTQVFKEGHRLLEENKLTV